MKLPSKEEATNRECFVSHFHKKHDVLLLYGLHDFERLFTSQSKMAALGMYQSVPGRWTTHRLALDYRRGESWI